MSAPPAGRTVPGNRWDLLDGIWPEEAPLVSVVVVHFCQPAQLARTLDALARQTHPAERLEVIVVDDGSPEAPGVPPGVTLLRQEDRGFRAAAARNLGAAGAQGEVLCFLDADTAPEPGYVHELTRLPAVAPEAVTVGRRRHADLAGSDAPVEEGGPAAELPAPAWLAQGYADSRDLLEADERSYRYVISAVLSCSAWMFAESGGFDEGFAAYGGEDWEWAHRAWLAGALLAHVPKAVAWHDGADWAARRAGDPERQVIKNREALRLADAIPVLGSRGRALRSARPDVVVRLHRAGSVAAAWVCVDLVLCALPEATVLVPDELAGAFAADARVLPASREVAGRVRVDVVRPCRLAPRRLRDAVDHVGREGLGALALLDIAGEELVRVTSARASARSARWGRDDLFPSVREELPGLAAIDGEPDLEAHLGGWTDDP